MISRLFKEGSRLLLTLMCLAAILHASAQAGSLAANHVSQKVQLSERSQNTQSTPITGDYFIGPADKLQISVWKNEALSQAVTVRPDGMISLPLVNEIKAAGLKPMQLRELVKNKLKEYMPNPEVSVIVTEMHSYVVSVLGEVRKPGRYEFDSQVTVLDVLAQSGGVTEFASTTSLFVLRGEGSKTRQIPFNYSKIITGSIDDRNFNVQPGDILVVP